MNTILATKNDLIDQLSSSHRTRYIAYQTELEDVLNNTFASPSNGSNGNTDIIQSRISFSLIDIVHKITGNKERCLSTISGSLLLFHQKLYEDVWKHHYNLLIAKEYSMSITKQDKRKRSAGSPCLTNRHQAPLLIERLGYTLRTNLATHFRIFR